MFSREQSAVIKFLIIKINRTITVTALYTFLNEMFLGKIKLQYVKTIADRILLNCRCEILKRKETKLIHYNFTGLTEQNIQSSFNSVLEICRMHRPRVFKSRFTL